MISLSLPFWHLFCCHPRIQQNVPVRKVWLGEVLLDSIMLVMDIVVCNVIAEEELAWIPWQCDYETKSNYQYVCDYIYQWLAAYIHNDHRQS